MATEKSVTMRDVLQQAIQAYGTYATARDADVEYASVFRFMHNQRDLRLASVEKICALLGYQLVSMDGETKPIAPSTSEISSTASKTRPAPTSAGPMPT